MPRALNRSMQVECGCCFSFFLICDGGESLVGSAGFFFTFLLFTFLLFCFFFFVAFLLLDTFYSRVLS